MTPTHASIDAGISTSKVVTRVFEQILEAIHNGQLQPGAHINDTKLADTFGVSRTPVREALQRLREIGVVEASANRFTRVAVVSPRETAEAMVVWRALFDALLDDVIPRVGADVAEEMAGDHEAFVAATSVMDMQAIATTNFSFFSRLSSRSTNAALRRAIRSVVHIVRLGSLHLPEYVDFTTLASAQAMLVDAVRTNDLALAHEAMKVVGRVEIPQKPFE
ncbi:MAG: GntR family transcriptional regulator [Terrimesophilobacter sp.]